MTDTVTVGHLINFSYAITDQSGNDMLTQPPLDSPAVWTDAPATPPVDTFVASADGTTALLTATAAGSDTVGLTVIVGGATFTASDLVTITAAPQVASGVRIVSKVV